MATKTSGPVKPPFDLITVPSEWLRHFDRGKHAKCIDAQQLMHDALARGWLNEAISAHHLAFSYWLRMGGPGAFRGAIFGEFSKQREELYNYVFACAAVDENLSAEHKSAYAAIIDAYKQAKPCGFPSSSDHEQVEQALLSVLTNISNLLGEEPIYAGAMHQIVAAEYKRFKLLPKTVEPSSDIEARV